ncbi:hypothetical protein COLO4_34192 [Corchorus olitorius]|uniref:Uncharacterized protein n=1 Tax=Corchorus olitorius TaxID=93759 RepID=A0A1R3GN16_9ROSI|nr:hypothetical protein COLO4_34192 [Corchorus olitorius]
MMKKDESTGEGTKQSRLRRKSQSLRHTSVGDVVNLRLPFETDNEGGGGSRHCRSETGGGASRHRLLGFSNFEFEVKEGGGLMSRGLGLGIGRNDGKIGIWGLWVFGI